MPSSISIYREKLSYCGKTSGKPRKQVSYSVNMHNIVLSTQAIDAIATYITSYRTYYSDLYRDSGIWWEDIIIENYFQESLSRKAEILKFLERRLSGETVLWRTPNNTLFIWWRSKILFVEWTETDDTRTITHLSIR
jgi:hypothetical protein